MVVYTLHSEDRFCITSGYALINVKHDLLPGKRGFLNVRVTRTEYDELFAVAGKSGCEFGSPITLYSDFAEAAKGSAREGTLDANFQRSQTDAFQNPRLFERCTDVSVGLSSYPCLLYGI